MLLTCPRCGLSLAIRSMTIAPSYCPRCLARRREAVELVRAEPMQAGAPTPADDALVADDGGGTSVRRGVQR